MSLTKKLLSSFGAMLGLVLLLGVGALLVTRDLSGDLEHAANVTARQQYLAGQVSADAAELTSLERGGVLATMLVDTAHQQAYQQEFNQHAASLRKALSELRKLADTSEGAARLRSLEQQSSLVSQAHEELRQAMVNQQMDTGSSFSRKKFSLVWRRSGARLRRWWNNRPATWRRLRPSPPPSPRAVAW